MTEIYNLNYSVGKVIESAMKMAGIYQTGMGLTAEESYTAITELNTMLNTIQNRYQGINTADTIYKPIPEKSTVIASDGFIYECIKSFKSIIDYDSATFFLNGDLCYNYTIDNGVIYQVTTSAPSTKTLSEDWSTDKAYYSTDGSYYFSAYSSAKNYNFSTEPYVGIAYKLFWEITDTSYDLAVFGTTYSVGDEIVMTFNEEQYPVAIKVTTDFTYSGIMSRSTVLGSYADLISGVNQYASDTEYLSGDKVRIPKDTLKVSNISIVDSENNNIRSLTEVTNISFNNIYSPANNGTTPNYFSVFKSADDIYIKLYPVVNDSSDWDILKILRTRKYGNISDIEDQLELPSEMINYITLKLAHSLGLSFGIDSAQLKELFNLSLMAEKEVEILFKYPEISDQYILGPNSYGGDYENY